MPFFDQTDDAGDPIIQHDVIDGFTLASGDVVGQARLAYCVFGAGPDKPTVILHPALTGTPKAFVSGRSSQGDGWWSRCLGPKKFLDTDRVQVICVDHFGGNGHSTGAAELAPVRDRLSFRDTITLTARVLEKHGIDRIHAVVGGSIGGGQALEWLFQDRIPVERLVDVSGNSHIGGPASEFFQIQADLLNADSAALPEIQRRLRENSRDLLGRTRAFDHLFDYVMAKLDQLGRNYERQAALKLARKIGFFRFVTPLFFQRRWDEDITRWTDEAVAIAGTESWIDHQGEVFARRFSADGLASLCRMAATAAPRKPADVAERLKAIDCQLIGFSVSGDVLFDADRQFDFYRSVRDFLPTEQRDLVEIYFAYDEVNGHDHFLTDRFLDYVPDLSKHLYAAVGVEGFATRAIHQGHDFREQTGALIPPIYLTSTFESGNKSGFDYTRSGNPNFLNLENLLANLENAHYATVFASGVSAITAVVSTLKSGDLVMAEEVIYGCTYRLFDQVFGKFGVQIEYCDFSNPDNFQKIIDKKPALVWIESPTNPLLKIIDIRALSKYTRRAGSTLLVDNTFASSFFQRPLDLGADLSLASTTKYINGHSDCLGGVVCTDSAEWKQKMVFAQKALGLNPSPFDTWLITRGLKTLTLRMERHERNALLLAEYLESRPEVTLLRYPFLPSHPQFDVAKRQMHGGSGVVTADLNLPLDRVREFLSSLEQFTLAESLGGIESLVCHPATMSHASVPKAERDKLGITDSLVRFSVGVEHAEDLVRDVAQALDLAAGL
jgi:cystathionine gamma-synthase